MWPARELQSSVNEPLQNCFCFYRFILKFIYVYKSISGSVLESNDLHIDKQLFLLIAEGDEAAFERLFYRYLPKFQLVIPKIVRDETASNDIIQEIFLNIWINREKLVEIESPARWIFRVMYNRSLTWAERRNTREKLTRELRSSPASNDTEEAVFFSETARLVQEAILQLPPQTQKIYRLSRESGLKIPEIATQLSLSPNTVKNALVRAGKLIRDYLGDKGIVLPLFLFIHL